MDEKKCWVCGTERGIHLHHVFEGINRKNSDRLKLTVYLCGYHHNLSEYGVHFNKELDLSLKRYAQEYYEANLGTREDFMKVFGRNYIW